MYINYLIGEKKNCNRKVKGMIFYFSGTGNSKYVAKKLWQEDERFINIADAINKNEFEYEVENGERVGFVFPVYFYTLPTIVRDFVQKLILNNVKYVYGVITCGGGIGQSGSVLKKELKARGIELNYIHDVLMPDNSMLFYQIPDVDHARGRLDDAQKVIDEIIKDIYSSKKVHIGDSTVISDLMEIGYKACNKTAKFYAEDSCMSCGLCAKNCPQHVIKMQDGKPQWTKESCCKCSACINRCPVQAIQYGKGTKKRNRYVNPNYICSIEVMFDDEMNVIIFPSVVSRAGVSTWSSQFIKLEKGWTKEQLAGKIMLAINISETNDPEGKKDVHTWTAATGIKGFKAFSKKYHAVMVFYLLRENRYEVQALKRFNDGSYGVDRDDQSSRCHKYAGRPRVDTIAEQVINAMNIILKENEITPQFEEDNEDSTTHLISDEYMWGNDEYRISYKISNDFQEAKSHSELELLASYAPGEEYGREGDVPYVAVGEDELVYEYMNDGSVEGAIDFVTLKEKFLFKAKKEYYGDMMYFYAFERCYEGGGYACLFIVYPMEYVGTKDEDKMIQILDDAAQSFEQIVLNR